MVGFTEFPLGADVTAVDPPDPEGQLLSAGMWDNIDMLHRSHTEVSRDGLLCKKYLPLPPQMLFFLLLELAVRMQVSELGLVTVSLVEAFPSSSENVLQVTKASSVSVVHSV